MWLFLVPQGRGCHLSELKNNEGQKEKKQWLSIWSDAIVVFVALAGRALIFKWVCGVLGAATSFIKSSQNTTSHLNPMPYESWSSSKDSLFPSETGILSWLGGLFSGDLLWGTGWASNEHCDMHSCHALTIFQARKQTLLQFDPALVTGGLVVSLEAAFCPLGHSYALCSPAELWWKGLEAG